MSATLKLTHKAIGAEVRRGTYDVVVDGERVGSVEMNHTTRYHSSLNVRPLPPVMILAVTKIVAGVSLALH